MLSINKYRETSVRCSSYSSLSFSLYFFLLLVQRYKYFCNWAKVCNTNVCFKLIIYIYIESSCYATKATRRTTEILLLIIISTYIKTPWEFTTLPRIFLKTLLFDEVPYIGYQTDNICYYWNCPKGCRSCKKLRNVRN